LDFYAKIKVPKLNLNNYVKHTHTHREREREDNHEDSEYSGALFSFLSPFLFLKPSLARMPAASTGLTLTDQKSHLFSA
jgi:hypothetical protein